jgi:hypothetical protein
LGSGAALAASHGGGGWHSGGGGFHGGGWHGDGGGFHGGDRGWRGGFGWRGLGWGGLGLGLYFSTLPFYYSTFWWGGIPYYYADNTYYQYDNTVGQYETVSPPPEVEKQAAAQGSAGTDVIAYPKNGQTADQQANDKYACHSWAVTQSGFDPAQGVTASASKRENYMRAQAACLDGRGYSVK